MIYVNFITVQSCDYISDVEIAIVDKKHQRKIPYELIYKYDAINIFMQYDKYSSQYLDKYVPEKILHTLHSHDITLPCILLTYDIYPEDDIKLARCRFTLQDLVKLAPYQVSSNVFGQILRRTNVYDPSPIVKYIQLYNNVDDRDLYVKNVMYMLTVIKHLINRCLPSYYTDIQSSIYDTNNSVLIQYYDLNFSRYTFKN